MAKRGFGGKISFRYVLALIVLIVMASLGLNYIQDVQKKGFSVPIEHIAVLAKGRDQSQVVAPGFVEPITKELRLGFDMNGVIEELLVKEGQEVMLGQPLAKLRQTEYIAQVEAAKARVLEAKANLDMHETGARSEERSKAIAEHERAKIRHAQAQRELKRRAVLIKNGSIGKEELEQIQQDESVKGHELVIAKNELDLINDRYRREEKEMARQAYWTALANLKESEAMLDKTLLRAPVNGTILRIFSDPGEAYSIFAPSPVLSMGDISTLNVRVEVDERDVARIQNGQEAFVASSAFDEKKYPGQVTRMELSMTPKKTRSGDPSEPVDRSVLEVLVTLDDPGPFLSGMRVDVYIAAPDAKQLAAQHSLPAAQQQTRKQEHAQKNFPLLRKDKDDEFFPPLQALPLETPQPLALGPNAWNWSMNPSVFALFCAKLPQKEISVASLFIVQSIAEWL